MNNNDIDQIVWAVVDKLVWILLGIGALLIFPYIIIPLFIVALIWNWWENRV